MYIITNDQTYPDIRVLSTPHSVQLLGASLTGLTELTGSVTVYADNGFEMQVFAPADYARQEIKDGSWLLTNDTAPQTDLTPKELREQTYETEPIIAYDGDMITVDAANKLFLQYSAEGSTQKYMDLQILIGRAKAEIRKRCPDREETGNE